MRLEASLVVVLISLEASGLERQSDRAAQNDRQSFEAAARAHAGREGRRSGAPPTVTTAARVIGGVFGAVGVAQRRASKALDRLSRRFNAAAERAENISRLVYATNAKRRESLETAKRGFKSAARKLGTAHKAGSIFGSPKTKLGTTSPPTMTVLSERRNVSMHARTRFKLRAVPTEASTEPRATEAAETAADAEDAGEDEEDDTDDASTGSMPYLLFVVLVGFRLCNAVATALPALFGESSDDAARRAALGKACAVAVVLYSCCSSSVFQSRRRGDAVDATADDFASEDAAPVDAAPACDAPPDARTRTQRLRTTTVTLSVVATLAWSASSALQALKPHDLSWCSAAAALFRSARPPVADSRRKRFHDDGRRPYDDGRRRPYDRRHDDSYAGQRRQRHDAGAGPRRGDGAHSLWAADDVWGPTGSACDAQGPCDAATTCGALVLSPADGDRAGDGDGRAGDDRGGDDRGGGDRGGGDRRGLSEALVSAMWTAGGRGLSAHIAERLSRALEVALDVSSSFGCNGARVDLGKRAPEVLRFKRLADRPQHLVNQLGGTANELAVFDVDLEWVLEDAQIAMDLTMTGTLAKYAVPKLGLVFANATLRRTRTTFAFELEAAYPFVRRVAASFATTPVLESRSYVGADSGSADFEFQPFAALLRDELVAALPVEPRALSFDLGLWLTTCNAIAEEARGDDDQHPGMDRGAAADRHDRHADAAPRPSDAASPRDGGAPPQTPERPERRGIMRFQRRSAPPAAGRRETPLARAGHWLRSRFDAEHRARRRQQRAPADAPPDAAAADADAADAADAPAADALMTARSDAARRASVSLQQRDEAARSRLGVERRNLAAAADAVQRERDNLVAAARATRQALSDRVVVAFRLQLAEELRSLGSAASWARGTGARPALSS